MIILQNTELRFMRWLRKREFKSITFFLHLCTELGSYKGWTLLSLLVIFLIDISLGVGVGISSLFGGLCAQFFKCLVQRQRPCFHPNTPPALTHIPDSWSFPSGHTTSAFSVVSMLWCIKNTLFWPLSLFAIFVGFSRIYLGVHYPSDVCVGAVLGIICGYLFGSIW